MTAKVGLGLFSYARELGDCGFGLGAGIFLGRRDDLNEAERDPIGREDGDCGGEMSLFEMTHSIVHFELKYSRISPSYSLP